MFSCFPARWGKGVNEIVFYQGNKVNTYAEYYKKEGILGLFWPKTAQAEGEKIKGLQELLIALEYIAANGDLPVKLSASALSCLIDNTAPILEKCSHQFNIDAR